MTDLSAPVLRRKLADIPGPAGHPLFGVGREIRQDVLGTLLAGFRDYGDVVAYPFGPRHGPGHVVLVAAHDPHIVRQILTESERAFGKQTIGFTVLAEILGRGLLTTEGDVWRRQRRTLAPLFTPRHVAGYAALMAAEADRLVADAPVGEVIDLHLLMMRYTLRVVGRALFGDDVEDAVPDLHDLVPLAGELTVARTMQMARLPLVWPTPRNRRINRVRSQQYAIVERILARHDPHDGADDLVTRLLAARDPETGRPLSPQEVRDQVLVFLLAGHETTAGALTFTLHQLGQHRELQDAAAGDAEQCRAALLEGMRLYPPAYLTERIATADTDLGPYEIPRGTPVIVSPWVTHRHPAHWPDPERYDPARFASEQDRPRYAYFPFGGGPRGCIGEHFALLEATVLLQALLAHVRVRSLHAAIPLRALVTLRPAGPVLVRLRPR